MDIPKLGESSKDAMGAVRRRRTRGPHPTRASHGAIRKLPPPLPAPTSEPARPGANENNVPTLPIKVLQGTCTRRTDTSKPGYGREVIFVTRKTTLGSALGRCKSLVMDEGYTRVTIHALSAAIPQAMMLLHALLDILPYPRSPRGLWYEIRTDSVECTDEVEEGTEAKEDGFSAALAGIGAIEAAAPKRVKRLKSSIQIDLYIGPKAAPGINSDSKRVRRSAPGEGKARPSKKRREALRAKHLAEQPDQDETMGEEEMMNMMEGIEADVGERVSASTLRPKGAVAADEHSEEEEEVE